jgi:hypothetical protein
VIAAEIRRCDAVNAARRCRYRKRRVSAVLGVVAAAGSMILEPPDYASIVPWVESMPDGVIATAGPDVFRLSTVLPVEDADSALARTEAWWREWNGRACQGRYPELSEAKPLALSVLT